MSSVPYLYKTIRVPTEASYKVLGSRHLAFAFPVESEEEIKSKLGLFRGMHHAATHICFAWRLGARGERYRYSDDGEPSGTAGRPIYGQILSFGLTNIMVIVVRYFGGTKLGTGGLVDAYKTAAKMALQSAIIIEKEVAQVFSIQFPAVQMPAVMKILKERGAERSSTETAEFCKIVFSIPERFACGVIQELNSLKGIIIEKKQEAN
ncbi:MAG: YigZ family protein [Crocinitomicaceae bacterium]|nr:YigZ family protein [Crocinitomicaceae bacterium]